MQRTLLCGREGMVIFPPVVTFTFLLKSNPMLICTEQGQGFLPEGGGGGNQIPAKTGKQVFLHSKCGLIPSISQKGEIEAPYSWKLYCRGGQVLCNVRYVIRDKIICFANSDPIIDSWGKLSSERLRKALNVGTLRLGYPQLTVLKVCVKVFKVCEDIFKIRFKVFFIQDPESRYQNVP